MILTFLVRNQTLTYLDTKLVPRIGSAEYLQLKFKFITSDWVNLRKTSLIYSMSPRTILSRGLLI